MFISIIFQINKFHFSYFERNKNLTHIILICFVVSEFELSCILNTHREREEEEMYSSRNELKKDFVCFVSSFDCLSNSIDLSRGYSTIFFDGFCCLTILFDSTIISIRLTFRLFSSLTALSQHVDH